jgi:hypothetical protein
VGALRHEEALVGVEPAVREPAGAECFSFNLLATSSSVPLKGPGVSILIETSAAANLSEVATS